MPIEVGCLFSGVIQCFAVKLCMCVYNIEALFHKYVDKVNSMPVL